MKQQPSPYLFSEEEDTIDIKQVLQDYLRYWPWFILGIVCCLSVGYLYLRYTPKIYETSAKIKILGDDKGINLPMEDLIFNKSNVNLENEIEIISSYRILERVVNDLHLSTVFYEEGNIQTSQIDAFPFNYEKKTGIDSLNTKGNFKILVTSTDFEIYNTATETSTKFPNHDTYVTPHSFPFQIKIANPEQLENSLDKQYSLNIVSSKEAVLALKKNLEVASVGKKSDILQIRLKGRSPSRSEQIINAVVRSFNEDGIQDRQLISKRTLDFIDDRFLFLAEELDSIELNKRDFKQDNNLVYIEADTELSLQKRAQADEEVFRIENQLALSQLLEDALKHTGSKNKLLPANIGLESSTINSLIENYNVAILERNKLISSGGVNNPIVQQLQIQLTNLRANIDKSIEAYKNQLNLSQKQLKSRDIRFKSEVYSLPQKEKLLRAINRQQKIKESLYLLLLQKREEAAISLAVTEPTVKVVEYALSGSQPVSPKPKIIYMLAMVLGLLIPFGFLFVVFLLDTKVHGKKDIENITTGIPILGEIPKIKKGNTTVFSNPNDRSVLAESFRILSSNTNFILPIKDNDLGSVIYCTSTIKGEGKTFTSLNLSLALSSLNKKVLLIGADLRNPQLHKHLNIDKNRPGLSNYLHDTSFDWKEGLVKGFSEHSHHDSLISGEVPPNPPHLLTNGRFEMLLEEAKTLYDFIIVDTAPTLLVTDTLLISKFADATVYITRANYTEKGLLEHCLELSINEKLKNMAFVINSIEDSKKSYGYSYGYNGEEEVKKSWFKRK